MAGTVRNRVAGFGYAEIERALGTLFGVPASAQGSFRARVRHLQRVGLVEVTPGKGRRISYTRIQAGEWMLALLLAEFGIDPVVIVNSIQRDREQLREWIAEATEEAALGGDEVFLTARPALMSEERSAGVLRFGKFRRGDWALKVPRHPPPPPSRRPPLTAAVPHLTAPPSPPQAAQPARPTHGLDAEGVATSPADLGTPELGEPEGPVGPTHALDAEGVATGPADLGTPELGEIRFLDWADPLLLVINLTGSLRVLGAALESAPGD
jgi:hypothetical protein